MTRYGRDFTLAFWAQFWFTIAATFWCHYARWISLLGGTEAHAGLVLGLGTAATLLLRPWIAQGIDRFGAKRAWIIGMAMFAVAGLLNFAIDQLSPWLFAIQALAATGLAVIYAAGITYVADIATSENRTEMIGAFGVAGFAGVLVGPYIGDLLLDGAHRERIHFMRLFGCMAGTLLLASFLAMRMKQPARSHHPAPFRLSDFVGTMRRHWPGAIAWVNLVFGLCMAVPFRLLSRYIDAAHLTSFGLGGFFLAYAGVGIAIRLGMKDLPERWGLANTVTAAMSAFGVGVFCFLFVDEAHPWRLLAPAFICGAAHAVMFHSMVALTIAPFPKESRGSGAVLALLMQDVGQIVGLPILGRLAYVNFNLVFIVVAACCLLMSAAYAGSLWRASYSRSRRQRISAALEPVGTFVEDRRTSMGRIPAA